jgi:hypothetical protein
MKSTNIAQVLRGVLALIVLCAFARADAGGQAPQFAAQTPSNVGEPAAVRTHFESDPSSCRVAPNNRLIAQVGAYAGLVGKGSNIGGTQNNPSAADSLQQLLSRAGRSIHSNTQDAGTKSPVLAPSGNGAKVIEVPRTEASPLSKRSPKTLFVFANGERLEADHYTIDAGFLHLADGGHERTVRLGTLDIKTTLVVNRERGIELKIPQSRSEITIAF